MPGYNFSLVYSKGYLGQFGPKKDGREEPSAPPQTGISDWNPAIKGQARPSVRLFIRDRAPFPRAKIPGRRNMPERDGLISTAELASILDPPDLRLFDSPTLLDSH